MATLNGSSFDESSSSVLLPPDSPGSSVSSRLQNEYEELLRYAVVTPNIPLIKKNNQTSSDHEKDTITEHQGASENVITVPQHFTPQETVIRHFVSTKDGEMEERDQEIGKSFVTVISDEDSNNQQSSLLSNGSLMQSPSIDADLSRLENQMNTWSLDLKRHILAEFTQSKLGLISKYKEVIKEEREKHIMEVNRVTSEIESMKELLSTYEQSIERKDCVITDLTKALEKQRERLALSQQFCKWKLLLYDKKREAFASKLATKHYRRTVAGRAWVAWHGVVEAKWRQRVEKSCQARAQEVCMALTEEYEQKLAALSRKYEDSRSEIALMQKERQHYEETMKKAFMRGVCALNLEAMTMFREASLAVDEGNEDITQINTSDGITGRDVLESVSQIARNHTFTERQIGELSRTLKISDSRPDNQDAGSASGDKLTVKTTLRARDKRHDQAKFKVERHKEDVIVMPHGDVTSKKRVVASGKVSDSKGRKTHGGISTTAPLVKVVE